MTKWTLVTGGDGFIGSNLCQKLLREGKFVLSLDNHSTSSKKRRNADWKNTSHYKFIFWDITRKLPENLSPKNMQINTVYHLACPTGVNNLIPLAEEMLLTCSIGTKNVLELAKAHNANFIFSSSSEVYGNPQEFPQYETYTGNVSPVDVRSPYEEGKRFAESLVTMYHKKYNLPTKIVRIFNTYGPYMNFHDSRVIPRFVRFMLLKKPLPIFGDGRQKRTFCFVNDLVDGLCLIAEKGKNGEVYNLGSDKEISIYNLAKMIFSLHSKKIHITFSPHNIPDHARRLPSLMKVKKLGWNMRVSLSDGLWRTLKWYGLLV